MNDAASKSYKKRKVRPGSKDEIHRGKKSKDNAFNAGMPLLIMNVCTASKEEDIQHINMKLHDRIFSGDNINTASRDEAGQRNATHGNELEVMMGLKLLDFPCCRRLCISTQRNENAGHGPA